MLKVTDLQVSYGQIRALKGVSLEVRAGEVVVLIGANGAGKSTLLRTISGLLRPQRGRVELDGRPIHALRADEIVRLGVVQVPEGRAILRTLTVEENLEMGAYLRTDRAGIERDRQAVYARFPVLVERRRQVAGSLSGGEQQMLAIGRALMARPRLLMMDEPSLGLAPLFVVEIFRTIRQLHQEGITILLVEQNARKALQVAHRGSVLEAGAIVLEGEGRALLADPKVQEAYLGSSSREMRLMGGTETL